MVEGLVNLATVRTTSGKEHTGRFSPGYGDMPLDLQGVILELLEAGKRLGIALGESKLMSPSKSVTALIGIK
jgi:cobalamin-dependent methionine synthase I